MNQNEPTERMFSQEEVNRIVAERLKEEKLRSEKALQQLQEDMKRRERLFVLRQEWTEKGLPSDILDYLDLSRPESVAKTQEILAGITAPAKKAAPRGGYLGKQDTLDPPEPEVDAGRLRSAFGLQTENRSE